MNSAPDDSSSRNEALTPRAIIIAAGILAGILLAVLGDELLIHRHSVISTIGCDIFSGVLAGKEFLFGQLKQGNFALWCPSVLCGSPCFGGFQSGLVYPLSFPYLFLPAGPAINWSYALHTFLGGLFMYLWLGRQRLHRHAALAGALMFAFCAPFYLRLYCGHTAPHSTIAWIPLVLLALDGILATPSLGWMLLVTTAVTLEFLAGYPQILFYTIIAGGVYTLAKLPSAPFPLKSLFLLALAALLTVGLSSVQLGAGAAMGGECVRRGGVPYFFAASLSFPPESWLTLLRPGVFGDMTASPYWGRWYLWEMCLFFGTTGLFFAVCGLWHPNRRRILLLAAIALLTGLLAMGSYSLHFRFFYDHIPGFNLFRCNAKFIIVTAVFLISLSAHGLDLLFRAPSQRRLSILTTCAFGGGLLLAAVACITLMIPVELFGRMIAALQSTGQHFAKPAQFAAPAAIISAIHALASELGLAATFLTVLALILFAAGRSLRRVPQWAHATPILSTLILTLITLELFFFARQEHVTFPASAIRQPDLQSFLADKLGDGRIFTPEGSNVALAMPGVSDLWGYGSDGVIRRYAEFMAFTQGEDPDQVTGYQRFHTLHPRLDLLRCKLVLTTAPDGSWKISGQPGSLPRFVLVPEWRIEPNRDKVFAAISQNDFNPRKMVMLEREPASVKPTPGNGETEGAVTLLQETTDWQEIEVTVTRPAILLQTDLYTPNWKVSALPGSACSQYELIPGNYILRAIPLPAGHHRLRIEYRPAAFVIGKWISLISLGCLGLLLLVWRSHS